MALPAAAAAKAALKKLAIASATDKRTGKTVLSIIGGVVFALVTPVLALLAVLNSGAELDMSAILQQANNAQLAYFESIMLAIEDEITAQELDIDPLRAQIIFISALRDHSRDDDFFATFIACFADERGEFACITDNFDVAFTSEEIAQIEQLIAWAHQSQVGTPNNLHNRIAAMTADDDTPFEGVFLSPLRDRAWQSVLTSSFGYRMHPISGERRFHNGVDFGLPMDTAIYAAAAGRVLIVAYDARGFGHYVVVYHGGGYATLYAHNSRITVSEGQEVISETVVARSGNSGSSTGPHLHFEVIRNGRPVNPTRYLSR
ncbi:MAG: M23 family metallopeptidase [Oscillospiraceae bacterium]|nr:M23 family metallopeptidase [Oscillospiraceae bacterium]